MNSAAEPTPSQPIRVRKGRCLEVANACICLSIQTNRSIRRVLARSLSNRTVQTGNKRLSSDGPEALGCFSIFIVGPLQKFKRTFVASAAFTRICTRRVLSTARIFRPPPRSLSLTLARSFRISLPTCTVAEMSLGMIVFGASKVFTPSTFGALSVSPLSCLYNHRDRRKIPAT
jgi:hypothetical protein